ncbi:hypothetical protein [Rhodovulum euryhalinum]|uniref:Uncharacterized protein n=1 Tax=Rhodovulum euryhalinum TaxID=35805 RepID=A0A4V2SAD1_9RHOB|nr:hypothetical protein [Rhodovulum euryhalinum]TCO71250.1 hypothetical protein EV655_107143 [Rhodovulum euryhalinum]
MPQDIKIATCCYCGSRAALAMRGTGRHELACASCGAPLRHMKRLRADHAAATPARPPDPGRGARTGARPVRKGRPKHLKKGRKSLWRAALEEAIDAVEDLFD